MCSSDLKARGESATAATGSGAEPRGRMLKTRDLIGFVLSNFLFREPHFFPGDCFVSGEVEASIKDHSQRAAPSPRVHHRTKSCDAAVIATV